MSKIRHLHFALLALVSFMAGMRWDFHPLIFAMCMLHARITTWQVGLLMPAFGSALFGTFAKCLIDVKRFVLPAPGIKPCTPGDAGIWCMPAGATERTGVARCKNIAHRSSALQYTEQSVISLNNH